MKKKLILAIFITILLFMPVCCVFVTNKHGVKISNSNWKSYLFGRQAIELVQKHPAYMELRTLRNILLPSHNTLVSNVVEVYGLPIETKLDSDDDSEQFNNEDPFVFNYEASCRHYLATNIFIEYLIISNEIYWPKIIFNVGSTVNLNNRNYYYYLNEINKEVELLSNIYIDLHKKGKLPLSWNKGEFSTNYNVERFLMRATSTTQ